MGGYEAAPAKLRDQGDVTLIPFAGAIAASFE